MGIIKSFILLLARWMICAVFIIVGVEKFMFPDATSAELVSRHFPAVPFFLYASALLEIIGGLALFFGYYTRFFAIILALYLIPVTVLFHDFWNVGQAQEQVNYFLSAGSAQMVTQINYFFLNVSIIGGLLYVLCFGAGKWSFDNEG